MAMKSRLDIPDSNSEANLLSDYRMTQTPVSPTASSGPSYSLRRAAFVLLFRFLPLMSLLGGLACFSTPEWIHRLPESSELTSAEHAEHSENEEGLNPGSADLPYRGISTRLAELEGTYRRPVSTRYSVADPHSLSTSTQMLYLESEGNRTVYYKIHTYEEWVRGVARRSIYGEKGFVKRLGPWVLLSPRFIYRSAQGPVHMDHEEASRRCINSMDVQLARKRLDTRKRMVEGEPLLYFYNRSDHSLTPLAFEEEGKVYRFGFYEQLMGPYDQGTMLKETHKDLTLQTQNPHSYFLEGSAFLENYSDDPAMYVQKEMGLRTDCIQDLRPIQSSK